MKNSLSHWVLTLAIILWTFESPLGLQFPTWEFIWECEGSFPHTLLHSRGHENVIPGLSFGSHPCKPFALVASPRLGSWQNPIGGIEWNHFLNLLVWKNLKDIWRPCLKDPLLTYETNAKMLIKKIQGLHLAKNSSMNLDKGNMSLKDAKFVKCW